MPKKEEACFVGLEFYYEGMRVIEETELGGLTLDSMPYVDFFKYCPIRGKKIILPDRIKKLIKKSNGGWTEMRRWKIEGE